MDPVPPGPAVVVDLDGVLSDAVGRQRFLDDSLGRRDWDGFFDACGEDPLIEEVSEVLALLHPDVAVLLLTGRPLRTQQSTMRWLDQHGVRWDVLVMRHFGDHTAAREFKHGVLAEFRAYGFDVRLAFEDDPRNVAMFRQEGVRCLYIHSGYYDLLPPEDLWAEDDSASPSG